MTLEEQRHGGIENSEAQVFAQNEFDNKSYKQKRGTEEWKQVDATSLCKAELQRRFIHTSQPDDEPKHWSLAVAKEGEPGQVSDGRCAMHDLRLPDEASCNSQRRASYVGSKIAENEILPQPKIANL